MARPKKQVVDYFSHDTDASLCRTLTIIQNKYGNNGYAFWFKLLELLGRSPGHYYSYENPSDWEFLLAKTHVSDAETAKDMLETLALIGAIDADLHKQNIIWSQNFVDRLEDVYKKRETPKPERPITAEKTPVPVTHNGVSVSHNTQTKLNKTKLNKTKNKKETNKERDGHNRQEFVSSHSLSNNKDNGLQNVLKLYDENIQPLSSAPTAEIEVAVMRYGEKWVRDAIREAVEVNKLRWCYIRGILRNWEKQATKK